MHPLPSREGKASAVAVRNPDAVQSISTTQIEGELKELGWIEVLKINFQFPLLLHSHCPVSVNDVFFLRLSLASNGPLAESPATAAQVLDTELAFKSFASSHNAVLDGLIRFEKRKRGLPMYRRRLQSKKSTIGKILGWRRSQS